TAAREFDGSGSSPILLYLSSLSRGFFGIGKESVSTPGFIDITNAPPFDIGRLPDWQQGGQCCASVLHHVTGYRHWSSAIDRTHTLRRIANVDVGDDGVTVTSYEKPALAEGGPQDPDARGVGEPDVLFDSSRQIYRMWFVMYGPLGGSTIG